MKGFGQDWTAFIDTWKALPAGDWSPLVAITEEAVRTGIEAGDSAAWDVALQVNADMPRLIDLAITQDGLAFLRQALKRTPEIAERIVKSRRESIMPLLVGHDLVPLFEAKLEQYAYGELDYISRVWEMEKEAVPMGPFEYVEDQEGMCALLRVHILNGQPLRGDERLLAGIRQWPSERASVLVSYSTVLRADSRFDTLSDVRRETFQTQYSIAWTRANAARSSLTCCCIDGRKAHRTRIAPGCKCQMRWLRPCGSWTSLRTPCYSGQTWHRSCGY